MAHNINQAAAFLLIALTLFAAANPLAGATFVNLNVLGQLCCTSTGNCPGTGLPGVRVSLNCTTILGTSVVVGQNTTNVNGFFNITVPNTLGLILNTPILPCNVVVQLPLNQTLCPVLSTVNSTLLGVLQTVNRVSAGLFNVVQTVSLVGFVNVTLPLIQLPPLI